MYKVSKYGHAHEHIVNVTELDHILCTCIKFECMNILCCHALRILDVVKGANKINSCWVYFEKMDKKDKGWKH